MTPLTRILIALAISVVIIVFTIGKVRNSKLSGDAKTLLVIITVFAPLIGLITFYVLNYKYVSSNPKAG